ncbi:MAG: DUF1987 domain-containing protein [Bacteroidetes bacterium]|nr:MAG: DUF1987 domain-containing protein [Bacteroidota bacterium]
MNALFVESTELTPKIVFDPINLKFEISGESRPESGGKFYVPLEKWLNQYQLHLIELKKAGKAPSFIFKMKFEYFNSSSSKYIYDLLTQIVEMFAAGIDVKIHWHYDSRDTDMEEAGEEFAKLNTFPVK